jgi:ABC-type bacteriocin/lantibiotic exporter with double-glycine peptidase domain
VNRGQAAEAIAAGGEPRLPTSQAGQAPAVDVAPARGVPAGQPVAGSLARRRLLAPEVVQTSAMDCGPAALKCLLEGFHIPVSYGRLREACQTDVDGTSIDTLEVVANQLGVGAEQIMIPADHVFLPEAAALPAIVVVRQPDGVLHFVVLWRRHGAWLQVMDPAVGRRWVHSRRFSEQLFSHQLSVAPADWRAWAESDDFLNPVRRRIAELGAGSGSAETLVTRALEYRGWFALAALDASIRLVDSVMRADGVARGADAVMLLAALFERTCGNPHDIFKIIPAAYWSAIPDIDNADRSKARLASRGAVLLRVVERRADEAAAQAQAGGALSPELAAALAEPTVNPLATLWGMLKADGVFAPLALVGATVIAVGATVVETLLFRGIFELGGTLKLPAQRLVAVAALLAFVLIILLIRIPVVMESLRFGRHLELRLRMALMRKLPELSDRYFHSRPVSDMADRSHSIHLIRQVPAMGLQLVQCLCELLLTLAGIALIAPASAMLAMLVVALAIAVPLALQPFLNERDLRVRNQGGALNGFYLDALLGLVPIRTHRAEQAVRRQHEALLVEWVRSSRSLVRLSTLADGVQSIACLGLVGVLLIRHLVQSPAVTGADLLLVYWALKLPGLGNWLSSLSARYPAQRNILLRLLEPLAAPAELAADAQNAPSSRPPAPVRHSAGQPAAGMSIDIVGGKVLAAGHTILDDINLRITPGEHVAIVGLSGAGKSTLLGLLMGWHRLGTGQAMVDGRPLAGAAQENLRRQAAWVDPAVQIWNRPFLDNLRYSSHDDGLDRIGEAIDAAHLRQVLQKLPQGLQTWLGEAGALLSGGEGQRVRLARALVQSDVRLALLDEPFRGLDRGQRSRLLGDARQWWRSATMLCVTHDVGETLAFDRVLVIEGGRIVEDGAPVKLARTGSRYRELLEAERSVREQLWNGKHWRRIAMQDGKLESA